LLARRLQEAREEESGLLARRVHDQIGQQLTAIKYEIAALGRRLERSLPADPHQVHSISELLDQTIRAVQQIGMDLRPAVLDQFGLGAALEALAAQFQERYQIKVLLTISGPVTAIKDQQLVLYRISQEALTNVARHASASTVTIHLEELQDTVVLEIRDDGKGFSEDHLAQAASVGIFSMQERAYVAGGTAHVSSAPGQGTLVRAQLPTR
jgi:signal transduction histidine kinase